MIILTIILTLTFDWGLGYFLNSYKNKQLDRDDDVFTFKIEEILEDKSSSDEDKIYRAKKLCRETKGKMSAGAYIVLDTLEYDMKK